MSQFRVAGGRRRASGISSPLDVSGCVLWLDASDITTLFTDAGSTQVTAAGDLVYQWNDKSGQGNHATQTTSGNRPAYRTAGVNSLPSVDFERSRVDRMSIADDASLQFGTGDFWMFGIVKPESIPVGGADSLVFLSKDYTGFEYFYYGASGGAAIYMGGTAGGSPGVTNTLSVDQTARFDGGRAGTTGYCFIDDLYGTNTETSDVSKIGTALSLGMRSGAAATAMDGDIPEVIIYNRAPSSDELTAIRDYLDSRWGVV